MDKENIKIELIDNIINYFRYQLISEIEEHSDKLPIFNNVLNIMLLMNKNKYSYTLVDIDDTLFDSLISEISNALFIG